EAARPAADEDAGRPGPRGREAAEPPDLAPGVRPLENMSQQPTIVQLLHSLNVGGAEVLAARIGRQLRERYRFLYVCLDGLGVLGEQLRAAGFVVHLMDRRPGIDWRMAYRLSRFLRQEQVDLI